MSNSNNTWIELHESEQLQLEPIRDRLLEAFVKVSNDREVVPAELLRKDFEQKDQRAVSLALMELRAEELLEPAECVAVLYHKSGFLLDVEHAPGYRLTEKGRRTLYFLVAKRAAINQWVK